MPLTPQITLTANLESIMASAQLGGALEITLCGFGPVVPAVAGIAMLADAGIPQRTAAQVGATPLSMTLWGNDVITPAGTFYAITVLDPDGNAVQSGIYQFVGTATIDLSNAVQIVQPQPPQIFNMVRKPLNGAVPGRVFTVPTPLFGSNVLSVDYKGLLQRPPTDAVPDYSLVGQTITMTFACTQVPYATYIQALA